MLSKVNTRLKIDLYSSSEYTVVNAQQGDNQSRIIEIELLNNGSPYSIPSSAMIALKGSRPDGHSILEDCQFSGNVITCELKDYVLAVEGKCSVKIELVDNKQILSSIPFYILVGRNPFDENGVIGTPQFSILTQAINAANEALEKATQINDNWAQQSADINSQWNTQKQTIQSEWNTKKTEVTNATNAAKTATQEAITATTNAKAATDSAVTETKKMQELNTSVTSAESKRVEAENLRDTEETVRQNNEASRQFAEAKRESDFRAAKAASETATANAITATDKATTATTNAITATDDAKAETQKMQQLNDSVTSEEAKRVEAEKIRVTNDASRTTNETARQQAEAKRQSEFLATKAATETAGADATKAAIRANAAAQSCEDLVVGKLPVATEDVAGVVKSTDDVKVAEDGKMSTPNLYEQISTAEGELLNLPTLNGGLRLNELRGKTVQTGKNLIDISSITNGTNVTVSSSGSVLTMSAVSGATKAFKTIPIFLKAGTYTLSSSPTEIIGTGFTSFITGTHRVAYDLDDSTKYATISRDGGAVTFTVSTDQIVLYQVFISENTAITTDIVAKFKELQLELGSTKTEYEPYVGGFPSPTLPIPVKGVGESGNVKLATCGKNLFNLRKFSSMFPRVANGITFSYDNDENCLVINGTTNGTNTATAPFLNILDVLQTGETYCISCTHSESGHDNSFNFKTEKHDGTIGYSKTLVDIDKSLYSAIYVYYQVKADTKTYNNVKVFAQLEIGKVATAYEPYIETTATIALPAPLFEGDTIEKRNGVWGTLRSKSEIVLNGNSAELWRTVTQNGLENTLRFDISNLIGGKVKNSNKIDCNRFIPIYGSLEDIEHVRNSDANYSDVFVLYINKSRLSSQDISGLRRYLQSNPITVIYELETPIFTPLPQFEQEQLNALQTYDGQTNVFTDDELSPYLSVSYGKTDVASMALYTENQTDDKAERVHPHTISQITDFPESMPANGGNADTIQHRDISEIVLYDTFINSQQMVDNPVDFLDTRYLQISDIADNLNTSEPLKPVSVRQVKILNDKVDSINRTSNLNVVTVGFDATCNYVCDGVNDESKFQKAVDYIFSIGGGTVKVLNGTYVFNMVVYMKTGVSLEFENAAKITMANQYIATLPTVTGINTNTIVVGKEILSHLKVGMEIGFTDGTTGYVLEGAHAHQDFIDAINEETSSITIRETVGYEFNTICTLNSTFRADDRFQGALDNIKISGGEIDGNKENTSVWIADMCQNGLIFGGVSNLIIENVYVHDFRFQGMHVTGAYHLLDTYNKNSMSIVRNCVVNDCGASGICVDSATDVNVIGCIGKRNLGNGLQIVASSHIFVSGGYYSDNGFCGIRSAHDDIACYDVRISGATVVSNPRGIGFRNMRRSVIQGCICESNSQFGIIFEEDCQCNSVIGSNVYDSPIGIKELDVGTSGNVANSINFIANTINYQVSTAQVNNNVSEIPSVLTFERVVLDNIAMQLQFMHAGELKWCLETTASGGLNITQMGIDERLLLKGNDTELRSNLSVRAFGCNGKTPQAAATINQITDYSAATLGELATVVEQIKNGLIACGILTE